MNHLLVVCIGNICRSPMAEAMLKRALPGYSVQSAGVAALAGRPADPLAVQLMDEAGIDIRHHVAQQISQALVSQAELILVMDLEQKRHIENHFNGASGKVFRLGEPAKTDIPDPYREGLESFRHAHRLIERSVQAWVQQIEQVS